ncbi:hypothetical protein MASR1M12_43870 [Erysipelotrichia bacterium]
MAVAAPVLRMAVMSVAVASELLKMAGAGQAPEELAALSVALAAATQREFL